MLNSFLEGGYRASFNSMVRPAKTALIGFQIDVAESWYNETRRQQDVFAQFLFAFAGLNALYWLFREDRRPSEMDALSRSLQGVLSNQQVDQIVASNSFREAERFILNLNRPLHDMDTRTNHSIDGQPDIKQENAFIQLRNSRNSKVKLESLLKMAYQARCNLVHGSKNHTHDGDRRGIGALAPFLIEYLEACLAGNY
jgi:hypothetical protein